MYYYFSITLQFDKTFLIFIFDRNYSITTFNYIDTKPEQIKNAWHVKKKLMFKKFTFKDIKMLVVSNPIYFL